MGLEDKIMSVAGGQIEKLVGAGLKQKVIGEVTGLAGGAGGAGLASLLGKLHAGGLADQVKSWVGTGQNQQITGEQATSALGTDTVSKIANKLGLSQGVAASAIALVLPHVIDHLTPNGTVPSTAGASGEVAGLLKKLGL